MSKLIARNEIVRCLATESISESRFARRVTIKRNRRSLNVICEGIKKFFF